MNIPFNKIYLTGNEEKYIIDSIYSGRHCGNNPYCKKVIDLMKEKHGFQEVFLTPSCTSALEMGCLLTRIEPEDEVILPSYTFSSTVNAAVIFGAKPVFCEVDPHTMNIDVTRIEELITPKTKMILPIDYAGVPCKIDEIMQIAQKHKLIVLQDCAQSYGSMYRDQAAGTQAHLAAFSFHETKNYNAGEGGALIVNIPDWTERAHFLQEKGTDRRLVLRGVKNKYSWVDKGSSYLLCDILAAMLLAQLEVEENTKGKRKKITEAYKNLFDPLYEENKVYFYQPQADIQLNHHAFWVVFDSVHNTELFMSELKKDNISVYIGYLPLHSSPMGLGYGYKAEDLPLTEDLASRIVRLPFYTELSEKDQLEYTISKMKNVLSRIYSTLQKKSWRN